MSDNLDDFFAENTQWVDGDNEDSDTPEPSRPSRSRREMRRRRKRRQRRVITAVIAVVIVLALVGVGGTFVYRSLKGWVDSRSQPTEAADYPGPGSGSVSLTIEQGQTPTQIADALVKLDVVKTSGAFLSAFSAAGDDATLYPGTFRLKLHMNSADVVTILSNMSNAKGFVDVKAGDRFNDVIAAVVEQSGIPQSDFDKIVADGGKGILPAEAGGKFEGWLEPGTYSVSDKKSAADILASMVKARIAKLDELGVPTGAQRERILNVASIAEAEVNRKEYYGKVVRVIENRIEQKMYLGMDSSLAYGLNKNGTQITTADIEDADHKNPYNLHNGHTLGLPPTPIGNPGEDAIKAALNPEKGDWLYFVTVNLDTGETKFVATEDEFWQIRQEYKDNNPDAN